METDWKKLPTSAKVMAITVAASIPLGIVLSFVSAGFVVMFAGIFLICLVGLIRAITSINVNQFVEYATTEGTIVGRQDSLYNLDSRTRMEHPESLTYNDVIEYEVQGQKYLTNSNFSRGGILQRKIGDKVTVVYDETDPQNAIVPDDLKPGGKVTRLFFIMGIITTIIGVIILFTTFLR